MVLHKHGDRLYAGVIGCLSERLRGVAAALEGVQGAPFLREMKARWDEHLKSTQMIRDILMVRPPPLSCVDSSFPPPSFRCFSARRRPAHWPAKPRPLSA